jgi:hypothetical protein
MTAQPADRKYPAERQEAPGSQGSQGPVGQAWYVLDETADIRFLPSGLPLALRWRGSLWQVIGDPQSWSSSSSWWEPGVSPLGGQGSVVTTRFWRFQTQTGPASPVLEFDMSTGPRHAGWRLRRVAHVNEF